MKTKKKSIVDGDNGLVDSDEGSEKTASGFRLAFPVYYLFALILTNVVNANAAASGERMNLFTLPENVRLVAILGEMYPQSITSDNAGNVYVAGNGEYNPDRLKLPEKIVGVILEKYDKNGNKKWATSFGSISGYTIVKEIAADQHGNILMVGAGTGIPGHNPRNEPQCYVATFDQNGRHRWSDRFGPKNGNICSAESVAVNAVGDFVVAGYSLGLLDSNAKLERNTAHGVGFARKYTSSGSLVWQRHFDAVDAKYTPLHIALDMSGNAYVTGSIDDQSNILTGSFLIKLDQNGNKVWEKVPVKRSDTAISKCNATDAQGNVYIVGSTSDTVANYINSGGSDIMILKYNSAGENIWTKMFGSRGNELVNTMRVDQQGQVWLVVNTDGKMTEAYEKVSWDFDYFIAGFDSEGKMISSQQFGSRSQDIAEGSAVDVEGNLYIVGDYGGKKVMLKVRVNK